MALAVAGVNRRQQLFVQEYPVDLNATKAAQRAGYSMRTAYSQGQALLKKPEIEEALERVFAERAKRTGVTQDWVVRRLRENAERAMQATPVLDRDGKETGEWTYRGQVANRALELLGKHLGMFPDRVEHTGADGGPIDVNHQHELLLERLERIAEEPMDALEGEFEEVAEDDDED